MSWAAREWAKKQTALPRKPFALLRHFADDANDEGKCWPDQDKLVTYTVWSKGTIKRWTDFLRAVRLISTQKRFNHRKGYCDALIYTLHFDRVVTPEEVEEVERQIAKLRFVSGGGKSQKQGSASEEGKSQPAANSKSQPAANVSQDPHHEGGADAAGAPSSAQAGRVAPPSESKSESSRPVAARARELTLTGSRPRTTAGREGHEHEARQGPSAPAVLADHPPAGNGQRPRTTVGDLMAGIEREIERLRRQAMLSLRLRGPPRMPAEADDSGVDHAAKVAATIAALTSGGSEADEQRARLYEYRHTGKWDPSWGPKPGDADKERHTEGG